MWFIDDDIHWCLDEYFGYLRYQSMWMDAHFLNRVIYMKHIKESNYFWCSICINDTSMRNNV